MTDDSLRPHNEWRLIYEGYDPDQEGLREAICTVGNGLFATRGAAPESAANDIHYPGTYAAGIYNRLGTTKAGREIVDESMVNLPNWLPLTFRIDDGAWFCIDDVEVLEYEQVLELQVGLLVRTVRFRDEEGRETSIAQRRLVHMGEPHLAALETTVRPENWTGPITFRATLDGGVENTGVPRYRELPSRHLEVLGRTYSDDGVASLRVRTVQSRIEIAEAMRVMVFRDDTQIDPGSTPVDEPECVGFEFTIEGEQGVDLRVEKTVALYTSRDSGISEPCTEAKAMVRESGLFAELAATHAACWDGLWARCTIGLDGHMHADLILNVHAFHVMQTVSPHTVGRDAGVPARGLHGEAYRGHVFWDELFIFPFLNYRFPLVARSLLMYRYHRLTEARKLAAEYGFEGALFPWQSGSSGREETQVVHLNPESGRWIPDNSHRQYHVSIAVAYNIWRYVQVTGDVEFLAEYGLEMFLEIARFWESIATYDPIDNVYDIVGVMGPDEFHDSDPNWDGPGLRNNTYTNVMVAWVFARAAELIERTPSVQRQWVMTSTGVDPVRLSRWDDIGSRLRIPLLEDGIPSQFQGYEELKEFDWDGYRERYGDLQRLDRLLEAEGDSVNRYKVSKQADVLMLMYLLSYEELESLFHKLGVPCDRELPGRIIEYYLARTSHGSTLSRLVHSWVLSRADRHASFDLFLEALESDVSDVQGGTTQEGIHLGAMAGTIDMIERGYSGMEVRSGRLRFDPALPDEISCVSFYVSYRHRWLKITLEDDEILIESEAIGLPPIEVECRGSVLALASGCSVRFSRDPDETRACPTL